MSKQITIIVPDNLIIIDGEGFNLTDEQAERLFPEGLHAIQGTFDKLEFEWAGNPLSDFNTDRFMENIIAKFEEVREANKPIPPTLKEVKAQTLTELNNLADSYHHQISGVSNEKLARYEIKAKAAAAHKASTATDLDLALLKPEAGERGLTLEQHVSAILTANAAFTSAAGVIEAVQAKGKLMIEEANSIEELEAIRTAIPQHAKDAFKEFQENLEAKDE